MGSKAQAKASGAWAAEAKRKGSPVRKTQQCPVGHTHTAPVGNAFAQHLLSCGGGRRKSAR